MTAASQEVGHKLGKCSGWGLAGTTFPYTYRKFSGIVLQIFPGSIFVSL